MELKDYRRQLMQDPEVAEAEARLRPKLELGRQILDLRLARGWTQKDLAQKAGTKQANISRLENGLLNPSVDMLQKIAEALDVELGVTLEAAGQRHRVSAQS
jgi:transcriptional regulator with XRE-family HTH domain